MNFVSVFVYDANETRSNTIVEKGIKTVDLSPAPVFSTPSSRVPSLYFYNPVPSLRLKSNGRVCRSVPAQQSGHSGHSLLLLRRSMYVDFVPISDYIVPLSPYRVS